MTAHHERGPSGADRWATCTASVRHIRALGEEAVEEAEREPEWTAEGSWLHDIAANSREFGFDPLALVGLRGKRGEHEFKLDATTARQMAEGLAWIDERPIEYSLVEEKIETGVFEGQFGTLDFGGFYWGRKGPTLVIFDWKWGYGVPVSPVENLQLAQYAKGFWRHVVARGLLSSEYAPDRVQFVFCIWQPRIPGAGGVWETTLLWVLEKCEWLAKQAKIADTGRSAEYRPSEKACRFCPGRKLDRCDAHAKHVAAVTGLKFADLDGEMDEPLPLPAVDGMTMRRREKIWRESGAVLRWLDQIEARLHEEAVAHGSVGGLKAVEGRAGARFWVDEVKAKKFLAKHGIEHTVESLRTPAQVEDSIPPSAIEDFKALVDQKPTRPILVDSTDKRPAIRPIRDKFRELDDE